MELPQHIADMCGIVSAKTQSQAPEEDFQAVKAIWDDTDGVMIISHRDKQVGFITESKSGKEPKYRALTANNRVGHFYTASQAMTWLIEEAF
jgi:hypothetical protein